MKITKKRCEFCHEWFSPNPRTFRFQRSCAKADCREKRKNSAVRNWHLRNPDYNKSRGPKIKAWAKAYPDYWRKYRRGHPDYVARDNQRRRSVYRRDKISAKQNTIAQISLKKLESIRDLEPISSAKQNAIRTQINGILDYLFWKEFSAKQNEIAFYCTDKGEYEYAATDMGGDKAIESG